MSAIDSLHQIRTVLYKSRVSSENQNFYFIFFNLNLFILIGG